MQNDYETDQLSIYDLDSWCGRMCGAFSSGTPKGEDFRIVLEEIVRIKVGGCFSPST